MVLDGNQQLGRVVQLVCMTTPLARLLGNKMGMAADALMIVERGKL